MIAASILDSVKELGGELTLQQNGKLAYLLPDCPEARDLLEQLRCDSAAIKALLRDIESKPPTLTEVKAALPTGVNLVSYQPKQVPFAVAPVSVVTNAGKFFRAYLKDLNKRLEKPGGHDCPPLKDILANLADAGLELRIGKFGTSGNMQGLEVCNEDLST